MMSTEYQSMAANGICHAASMMQKSFQETCWEYQRPSVVFRPKLTQDGNKWIACYGDDLQVGIVGIGDSPALAMFAFDGEWTRRIGT